MYRYTWRVMAIAGIFLAALAQVHADEQEEAVQKQKTTALAHWKELFGEDTPVSAETPHLLIYGLPPFTGEKLKELGTALEKEFDLGTKALDLDPKGGLWSGKVTVYLFDDRRQFNSFVRGVAKKRAEPDELGVYKVRGDTPFIGAGPPQAKQDPSVEIQAGEQLAAALLTMKGGSDIPDWVGSGFGMATVWRGAPAGAFAREQRRLARELVLRKRRTAKEVWSDEVPPEEATVLQASIMDFMAYGPGSRSFVAFLEGFKPDEEGGKKPKKKSAMDAFTNAKMDPDRFDKLWQGWVVKGQF